MTRRRVALSLIALALLFGAYVRFSRLGDRELLEDELDHVYAAQAIEATGAPRLPAGRLYLRGLDYTRLVRLALHTDLPIETAARLPAAMLGTLVIALFAAIAWRMAGPWPAVWSATLLAIFPEAVRQSRYARFYTLQLCAGLVAMLAVWEAIRGSGDAEVPRGLYLRRLAWLALATVAFLVARRAQVTTYSVMLGAGVALAVAAIADLRVRGRRAWRDSASLQAVVLGGAGAAMLLAATPEHTRALLAATRYAPAWARRGSDPLAYYYALQASLPLFVALAPVALIAALRRNPPLAAYLAAWAGVPLLLHSLVFVWKGERFILPAIPAVLLLGAIGAAMGAGALHRMLLAWMATGERGELSRRWAAPAAAATTGIACIVALVAQPAFDAARMAPRGTLFLQAPRWSAVARTLRAHGGLAALPLGASDALPALHYLPRVDFTVEPAVAEQVPRAEAARQGVRDPYAGLPLLATPAAIRAAYPHAPAVLVALDTAEANQGAVSRELLDSLRADAEDLCDARCGPMRLYRWPRNQQRDQTAAPP